MTKVEITFDTMHETWNVMMGKQCIFWSKDAIEVDRWLEKREGMYEEI